MKKIKLFTHNDLDGVGCSILAKLAFKENVDIEYCGYNDVNDKVISFFSDISNYNKYSKVYITDISVNEKVAELIEETNNVVKEFVKLIDHHKTAEYLKKYSWSTIMVENKNGYLESGTSLFYNHLVHENILKKSKKLDDFVDLVRQYDTWEWAKYNVQESKDLNDIFHLIGTDDFVNKYLLIIKYAQENNFELYENHIEMLKYKRKEIDTYIDKKLGLVKIFDDEFGNKVAFVVADNNISELGNKIAIEKECDYCCIYTGFNMSLRSLNDFDVAKIAKKYGGGGHKNASGMPVVKYYIDKYLES